MNLLEQHGLIVGVVLLSLVVGWTFLAGRRAARNVREFRDEHHETFLGTKKK
jgi:hypothetical protein